VFKKFLSLFISKAPWRFVYVVLVISVISMGWFAYQNAGDAIGLKASASSDVAYTQENALKTATDWLYGQTYLGDHMDVVNATCNASGARSYDVTALFTALDYRVDRQTGALHHQPSNHTVSMRIVNGYIVSATDGSRDILQRPMTGPAGILEEDLY
jgi:hypothetical protein